MEFERGAPPFIVLRRDQPAIEPQVFRAHRLERKRERVEVIGDGRQLARRRPWQSHAVGLLLELGEAARQHGERTEHAAEQDIEHADHRDIEQQGPDADRDGVFPGLGDFVGRLAGDLDLADAVAVGGDRHDMRLDAAARPGQRTKPAPVRVRQTCGRPRCRGRRPPRRSAPRQWECPLRP